MRERDYGQERPGVPVCGNRLRVARPGSVFGATLGLILCTAGLFFIFDCPFLSAHVTVAVPVIGGVLLFFVLSSLLHTTFSDPGILPRATSSEAIAVERQINQSLSSGTRRAPRTQDVLINGKLVRLKFCFTCKIFRPPRASHCSICDNCVERFDHHCPWVGNCVGRRNYRFFYTFLLSLALLTSFILAAVTTHIALRAQSSTILSVLKETPGSVLELLICFLSVWCILGLSGFHTYLVTANRTTNEDIKGSLSGKLSSEDSVNPYSHQSIVTNCCATLCGPFPPSFISSRNIVQPMETLPEGTPEAMDTRGMGDTCQKFADSCTA
ncbi:palmitoyltransferase ZDHHC18 isoform X1 [Ascaphus truei]|uniref:palmitoyltransferase ZDHHC18 isoform X1 n=1 Tax=Ascaphus truei TaxID=8439 RepID=UPI003F597D47